MTIRLFFSLGAVFLFFWQPVFGADPKAADNCSEKFKKIQMRWLIRRDMPNVLKVEGASFEHPWVEDDFLSALRQRNCIGMVAEHDNRIVGFMVYELHKKHLNLLDFAVTPEARRSGVGRQMIERLIDKLSQVRRNEIRLNVRETNLEAQAFFKAMDFKAVKVLRNHYTTHEDAYHMIFTHPESPRIAEMGVNDGVKEAGPIREISSTELDEIWKQLGLKPAEDRDHRNKPPKTIDPID